MLNFNKFRAILAIVLVAVMSLSLSACGTTTILLDEYIDISYGDYNGFGSPTLKIDTNGIDALVEDEKVSQYVSGLTNNELGEELGDALNFSDLIDFELKEDYSNLSNGDEIEVEVIVNELLSMSGETLETMQKALNITIKNTAMTFTVDGLEEAKILDAMGFIDEYIVYEGANGGAEASVQFPKDFEYEVNGFTFVRSDMYYNNLEVIFDHKSLGDISYQCENGKNLTKGQTYTITAKENSWDSLDLSETGYVINDEMTVTVPDLGEYVSSKEDITAELKSAITSALNAEFAEEEYEQVKIHGYYWGTLKASATTDNKAEDTYKIFVIMSHEQHIWGTEFLNYGTSKMIRLPDGTYNIELGVYEAAYDLDNSFDENYNYEKIEF